MGTTNPTSLIGCRHRQVMLMFFGLIIGYALRVNLSVGMVAMTNKDVNPNYPVLNWTSSEKGTVSGAFFGGYMMTQIPAGILAGKYGPCKLLGVALLFCGLITLLVPVAAIYGGFISVCVCRVLQGLGQGFLYPCINTHMSKWAIPQERSRLFSFAFGGTQFGTIVMLLSGGFLATSAGGWPSIYYVSGAFGVAWGIICLFFGADSPAVHKTISEKEKEYIESNFVASSANSKKMKIPWKNICTSIPMWALLIDHLAHNWGFWTLLTFIPTYIQGVFNSDIEANGFLSALPYLTMWLATMVFAFVGDLINKKRLLSLNISRKMWNSIAQFGGAIALFLLAYTKADETLATILLTISVGLTAGVYNGYLTNHLDLSPNFAGTLMGITNGMSNITSICGPFIVGVIVTDESDVSQWQLVFLISALVFTIGNITFLIFGSTETQPWNNQEVISKQ
ncbi:putative inorganic phosphate cotransporter [Rhodnius prolixus]|uniref:putative inorganic phosphate cotransporter n=1 Tax=Rhodnius prolixus TaxID=13249 RepID=UPI003D18D99C